jgi:zinc protease
VASIVGPWRSFIGVGTFPNNMTLVVCGDFETKAMLRKVRRYLGEFAPGKLPPSRRRPSEPQQTSSRIATVVRPITEAHLAFGFPIPGLEHEDVPALDLLAAVLGQGASSRLELELRRKREIVTEVRAISYTPSDTGIFSVFAVMPHHLAESAGRAMADQVTQLTKSPVGKEELLRARTLLEADNVFAEETVDGVARKLGYYGLHTGHPRFEETYLARLGVLEPSDLLRIARKYLVRHGASVVTVLPDPGNAPPAVRLPWVKGRGRAKKIDQGTFEKRMNKIIDSHLPSRTELPSNGRTPRVVRFDNGDTLVVRPDPDSRLVAMRCALHGGLRWEKAEVAGMYSLMASCLTRGTTERDATRIARDMDDWAGSLSGFTGRNTLASAPSFWLDRSRTASS